MQLYMPTKVYSEENCVINHGKELSVLGTKAMIVTGRSSAVKCGALKDVLQALGETPYILFDRVEENPSIETVMEARQIAIENGVDFFIGIGGGSPMDASKAISLMTRNPQATEDVLYKAEPLPHFPVACIPTTCGTGSEVTPYAILTRHAQQTKKSDFPCRQSFLHFYINLLYMSRYIDLHHVIPYYLLPFVLYLRYRKVATILGPRSSLPFLHLLFPQISRILR